jgi:hypothetical protein
VAMYVYIPDHVYLLTPFVNRSHGNEAIMYICLSGQ